MREVTQVLKRFEAARVKKTNWDETYREALTYCAPQRETFNETSKGQRRDNADIVFDSTPQAALMKFASNIQSSLVPPMKKWIDLAAGMSIPAEKREEVNKELSNIREVLFASIRQSNFDTQISESFIDLGIGTGAIMVFKGNVNTPIHCANVPLSQLYLEEGASGKIETVFRKHKIALRNITKTWEDAKIDSELKQRIEERPEEEIELVEATMPSNIEIKEIVDGKPKQTKTKGYKYLVIDYKNKNVLVERQQKSSPWIVFRWSVTPGETYGRGPALLSLADTKTLNKTKELILKNASIETAGVFTVVDDGVVNLETINIAPFAKIPVMSNGGVAGPSISRLPTGFNFNISQLIIKDLQTAINSAMFADPLGPVDLPVKTATEISIRQQELAKRIGSSFGRLQFELISPLINRILSILEELGLIDLAGLRADNQFISIDHISPLAMAQDQEEIMAMRQFGEILGNLFGGEILPTLMKPEEFAAKTAELLKVPKQVLYTKQETQAMKQKMAQVAQAQEMQMMQEQQTNQ